MLLTKLPIHRFENTFYHHIVNLVSLLLWRVSHVKRIFRQAQACRVKCLERWKARRVCD